MIEFDVELAAIRQYAIDSAIEVLGKPCAIGDVLEAAKQIEDYVVGQKQAVVHGLKLVNTEGTFTA